MKYMHK